MLRSSQMFRRQASTKPHLPRSMLGKWESGWQWQCSGSRNPSNPLETADIVSGFPMPVEAYPLFGIVAVMLSYATYGESILLSRTSSRQS